MAIQLYREGDTHTVRGILCELKNFDASELDYQLKQGWLTSPEDIGEKEDNDEDALNPVRIEAREKGIEGWDTKRIKTLEGLLSAED